MLPSLRVSIRALLALACALAAAPAAVLPSPSRGAVPAAVAGPATHLRVPAVFGDHMVLQRGCRVPVWGTADPGGQVQVRIDAQRHAAKAGADGRWSVRLDPLAPGPARELRVCGRDTLVFRDVLVGDVWLASGQSNMEMPVDGWGKVRDAAAEVAAAGFPDIRLLQVGRCVAYRPQGDIQTVGWRPCSPATVREFSAAAYFFGRELHRTLGVPIGLIHASWGGTLIEAWTSAGALRRVPELGGKLDRVEARGAPGAPERARADYAGALAAWQDAIARGDRGSAATPPWSAAALDTREWKSMTLPCDWENASLPDLDGVVWFRREVQVPSSWAGRDLELHLGRIDDADSTFFEGACVGTNSVYDRPRVYRIPARLVRAGRCAIAVRVYDWIGGGGLWGEAWRMKLQLGPADTLALAGEWSYRVGIDLKELDPRPQAPDDPNQPAVLSNGMIDPLVPFALRGAIWYQGEANADRAFQYRTLLPLLIGDWRARWGQGDFPFLFVQLAAWQKPLPQPAESDWAELREAQAMALAAPATGMAVAIDIGDSADIHPGNKQEVGRRLALQALKVAYGRDVACTGPTFASMHASGGQVRVRFEHCDGGLVTSDGGGPTGFAVAGADRAFRWATATVEGDHVVAWSEHVRDPVAVRYAWATYPVCSLRNRAGLPAVPFRSDTWPGVTAARR